MTLEIDAGWVYGTIEAVAVPLRVIAIHGELSFNHRQGDGARKVPEGSGAGNGANGAESGADVRFILVLTFTKVTFRCAAPVRAISPIELSDVQPAQRRSATGPAFPRGPGQCRQVQMVIFRQTFR